MLLGITGLEISSSSESMPQNPLVDGQMNAIRTSSESVAQPSVAQLEPAMLVLPITLAADLPGDGALLSSINGGMLMSRLELTTRTQ